MANSRCSEYRYAEPGQFRELRHYWRLHVGPPQHSVSGVTATTRHADTPPPDAGPPVTMANTTGVRSSSSSPGRRRSPTAPEVPLSRT